MSGSARPGRKTWLVLCIIVVLIYLYRQGRTAPGVPPELDLQREDYAQARRAFRTKLVWKGPSPHSWTMPRTPPGAAALEYASGGLKLRAFVSPAPEDGQRQPAVLFLHPNFALGDGDWQLTRPYREAGYAVMVPVLRAENGQEGDFSLFYDEVDDVLAAADALAGLAYVDAGRMYVAGFSVGGTLTMLAAMASPRFRAAASFSGSPAQLNSGRTFPFDVSDVREFRLRSPVAYATSFKCPVRIFYGSREGWAAGPSQRAAMLAKGKGLDVEALEVPGDHFSALTPATAKSIEFFRQR